MAFTLFDLLVEGYKKLGQLNVSTATGGTTTTIVDTKQIGVHSDNDWNDGAAFLIYDAGGAAAAPQGEMKRISDYVNSTGTFTIDAMTAAPAAGDRYAFVSNYFPLNEMIELANSTLLALGDVPQVDTTTLDTAVNQTEYANAVAWKRGRPTRIDYQGRTGDANDNQWIKVSSFDIIPATAGNTGLIILPQLASGRDIRVWFKDKHDYVQAGSDVIWEGFDPNLVAKVFAETALEWQNTRLQGGDRFLLQRLNDAREQAEDAMADRPIEKPKKKPKLFIIGNPYKSFSFKLPDE